MEDLGELLGGEDLRLHIRCANLVESLRLGHIPDGQIGPFLGKREQNPNRCEKAVARRP
jgi:hypothetical protein